MHILRCMGSKFCVKFQRSPLKFHTKFWTHTPQNMHFTVSYFCVWVTISLNCDVISLSETGPSIGLVPVSFWHCWQWDLVCDRSFLPEMTMMVFGIGAMVGDCFGNIIADKCGRKGVHITGYIIITICGSANAFSQNFNTYIALVFFTSICNAVST